MSTEPFSHKNPTEDDMRTCLNFLAACNSPLGSVAAAADKPGDDAVREAVPAPRSLFAPTPIRVECSWCGGVISAGREPASHGICERCALEYFQVDLNAEVQAPALEARG